MSRRKKSTRPLDRLINKYFHFDLPLFKEGKGISIRLYDDIQGQFDQLFVAQGLSAYDLLVNVIW